MLTGYKIEESIYTGLNTQIFRAVRESDGLPVILKFTGKIIAGYRVPVSGHEYYIGRLIDSHYAVKYLGMEKTAEDTVFVLQDDNMKSLNGRIPDAGFEIKDFLSLAFEICMGLEQIHDLGFIHKDIKPANIIVNENLTAVKFIDFSLADRTDEELSHFPSPEKLHGTLFYISPEQTGRINKAVDSRSDIYSTGITFYRMITGKLPFDHKEPMELIHSHIAEKPAPVSAIRSDIPPQVSMIIDKMIAKSPEERYQTAACLRKDIGYIKDSFESGNEIPEFVLGQYERERKLKVSGKIYGRENELKILADSFSESIQGVNFISVTGAAGIGKSAFIRELHKPVTMRHGFFVYGKFDQLNTGEAYTALKNAFGEFLQQCTVDEKDREKWKTVVQDSVGRFGQVLIELLPDFQELIGKQLQVSEVSPAETVTRRNRVFTNLIKGICSAGRPLILFFDDLQWADSASLALLKQLTGMKLKNLLVILAYREKEIGPSHPVQRLIEKLNSPQVSFTEIHLEQLKKTAILEWLKDTLNTDNSQVEELTEQLIARTEGNPLFTKSFLQMLIENDFIKYLNDGSLYIDLDGINRIPAQDDVARLLTDKIEGLEENEKEFIRKLSILGYRFSPDMIGTAFDYSEEEISAGLKALIDTHLLIKSGSYVQFTHDRIQQVAYSLSDSMEVRQIHLQVGENIKKYYDQIPGDHTSEYIHHLNASSAIINDNKIKHTLLLMNLEMGMAAKRSAAYETAEKYFEQAVSLLPEDHFASHYKLSIKLYSEFGEILYLNLKYNNGDMQFKKVIDNSLSPLDKTRVFIKQIVHYSSHFKTSKAMEISKSALKMLGIPLPGKMVKLAALKEFVRALILIRSKTAEEIMAFPTCSDPKVNAQMDLLGAVAFTSYISSPEYYPIIIGKMIRLTVQNGICRKSPNAFASFAVILCSLGYFEKGYMFGKLAYDLVESRKTEKDVTKICLMLGMIVNHWKKPLDQSVKYLKEAVDSGYYTGEYEFASFAAQTIMAHLFYSGESIEHLLKIYPKQNEIIKSFGQKQSIYNSKFWNQMLISMNDAGGDGVVVKGEIADESALVSLYEKEEVLPSLAVYHAGKLMLLYMAGDYEQGIKVGKKTLRLLKSLQGTILIPMSHFFHALTNLAYYRCHRDERSFFKEASRSLKKLRRWGTAAPENFLACAQLVEAELCWAKGKHIKAMKLYEDAVETAAKSGNNLVLGTSCECMGRYLELLGLRSVSKQYILKSIAVFQNWGALNKVERLKEDYGIFTEVGGGLTVSHTGDTERNINLELDFEILISTIRSLSGNLNLESLLEVLLKAIKKNSGATRVVYIKAEQGTLSVKAAIDGRGIAKVFDRDDMQLSSFSLPVDLITKSYRDSKEYFSERKVADESNEIIFNDKSVIILPLKRQERVTGLVYLENELIEGAFRKEHVKFLLTLAGQAAIAVENAVFIDNLNAEKNFSFNIISNASSMICGIDSKGIVTFINPAVENITGYSKNELVGSNWWKLLYPGNEYIQVEELFENFKKGDVTDYEMVLTCKNGDKRNVVWNSKITKEGNSICGIIGFGNDITQRKKAENELKKARNYISNIIDSMPSVLIGVDAECRVTQWNSEAQRVTGLKQRNAVGKELGEVIPRLSGEKKRIRKAIASRTRQVDLKRPRQQDGETHYEDVTVYPLVGNGVEGAVIRIDDVTDQVRLEDMMIQSEKMMSVGGLAAGMAHEINNPMAGMMQTAEVMNNRLVNTDIPANIRVAEEIGIRMEDVKDYMEKRGILRMIEAINETGRRVAGIVDNMLSFSRKSDSDVLLYDMADLMDKTLSLASTDYDLKKRYDFKLIEIHKEYEAGLPQVPCEGPKIQQVFLNILRNGAQAMQETHEGEKNRFILRILKDSDAKMLRIEIEDNGPGMDESTRKRIFEPFFTTKPGGIGTGLGLSVSYFIITEDHGGTMGVESELGKGARFIIRLPLCREDEL